MSAIMFSRGKLVITHSVRASSSSAAAAAAARRQKLIDQFLGLFEYFLIVRSA